MSAVNAVMTKVSEGHDKASDIRRMAEEWVAANKQRFDAWVAEAATK